MLSIVAIVEAVVSLCVVALRYSVVLTCLPIVTFSETPTTVLFIDVLRFRNINAFALLLVVN